VRVPPCLVPSSVGAECSTLVRRTGPSQGSVASGDLRHAPVEANLPKACSPPGIGTYEHTRPRDRGHDDDRARAHAVRFVERRTVDPLADWRRRTSPSQRVAHAGWRTPRHGCAMR
jgi:hypothetical protein